MSRRLALVLSLFVLTACSKATPESTRWNDAAAVAAPTVSASSAPLETGSLNAYFPKDGAGGYARVFTADKPGYAEAKLQKDGKDVAQLTISDADRVPGAKEKFATATEKLEGYPLMQVGKNQSTILVKDRLQVKVSSQTLDEAARKAILSTFDLKGLATR